MKECESSIPSGPRTPGGENTIHAREDSRRCTLGIYSVSKSSIPSSVVIRFILRSEKSGVSLDRISNFELSDSMKFSSLSFGSEK